MMIGGHYRQTTTSAGLSSAILAIFDQNARLERYAYKQYVKAIFAVQKYIEESIRKG